MEENCGNCKFSILRETPGNWDCRRYPPVFPPEGFISLYPHTDEDEWCGEWREKDNAEIEIKSVQITPMMIAETMRELYNKNKDDYDSFVKFIDRINKAITTPSAITKD